MVRFIMRYAGSDRTPPALGETLRSLGLEVLEATARMFLLEGSPAGMRQVQSRFPDWQVSPQQNYELLDPRPKIKRK